jgi:hypothetical protein
MLFMFLEKISVRLFFELWIRLRVSLGLYGPRVPFGFKFLTLSDLSDTTAQVWKNIQKNCKISTALSVHPSLNVTGPGAKISQVWTAQPVCDQLLPNNRQINTTTTCQAFSLTKSIPSAALIDMNNLRDCGDIGNGSFCLPLSCQVATVNYTYGASTYQFLHEKQPNITLIQFMNWNPYARFDKLKYGDVVCIGYV